MEFGAALRDMRLSYDADLATVATSLNIRQAYLQAIEDGRFEDLPGPTYASGFVRAYAEYLGLDMGEVMRRYRDVIRGGTQAPLVAPAPVSEGRMPRGFILLVAAVLAGAAYGSWYYLTLHERDAGEIVASVPQRIVDAVGLNRAAEDAAPAAAETGAAGPARGAPAVRPAPALPPVENRAASVVPEPAERVAPPPLPALRSTPDAEAAPARAERTERSTASASGASAGETAPSVSAGESRTADSGDAAAAPAAPADAAGPDRAPEPASESMAALAGATAVPPAPPPASRIAESGRVVLRATGISWVELRDADGRRVFSRLLKEGETYSVPPQRGITLATGNAGGLDILVDGAAVDPLGPVGAVRRDILLEPDALLDGRGAGR